MVISDIYFDVAWILSKWIYGHLFNGSLPQGEQLPTFEKSTTWVDFTTIKRFFLILQLCLTLLLKFCTPKKESQMLGHTFWAKRQTFMKWTPKVKKSQTYNLIS